MGEVVGIGKIHERLEQATEPVRVLRWSDPISSESGVARVAAQQ